MSIDSHATRTGLAVGICVCLLMADCGALPKVVSANESRVIVRGGGTAQEVTDLATKACVKYGKTARFSHGEGFSFWFDCV